MSDKAKIIAVVISGITLAFVAGYIIFSYFARNIGNERTIQITENSAQVENTQEPDAEGIVPLNGSVAGASDYSEGEGIGQYPRTDSEIDTQNTLKGGVLGESTTTPSNVQNGIAPNGVAPQKNIIDNETRDTYKRETRTEIYEDNYDDSEITLYEYPEVNEEDDYVEYIYTFEFNSDARKRYKDGFDYSFDARTCDNSKYFTSSKYDFKGTIDSNDIDDEVRIKVRIKDQYIDDSEDFDDSDYKFDGKNYVVRGDIQVPVCD